MLTFNVLFVSPAHIQRAPDSDPASDFAESTDTAAPAAPAKTKRSSAAQTKKQQNRTQQAT